MCQNMGLSFEYKTIKILFLNQPHCKKLQLELCIGRYTMEYTLYSHYNEQVRVTD